jgi:hypothetical protein
MARKRMMRTLIVIAVVVAGVALIAGCTSGTGGNSSATSCTECKMLLDLYPWLERIGLATLWALVQQNGPDIVAILQAALTALAG